MKKLIFLPAAIFVLAATVNAQTGVASVKKEIKTLNKTESIIKKEKREEKKELRKLEGKEVSNLSKQQFERDFGNIKNVMWSRTAYYDEATFMKHGKKVTAYYDFDTKLVGTTAPKTFADLPAKAKKYINEKYRDYSKENVFLFDDYELNTTDMILYGQQFDDADNYFMELQKGSKKIILQVDMNGAVSFFKAL